MVEELIGGVVVNIELVVEVTELMNEEVEDTVVVVVVRVGD